MFSCHQRPRKKVSNNFLLRLHKTPKQAENLNSLTTTIPHITEKNRIRNPFQNITRKYEN